MGDKEEEDRISWLPDMLLVEIMSRIKVKIKRDLLLVKQEKEERLMTTKEVIKTTSTISKRFQHLWKKLPTLSFIYFYDGNYYDHFTTRIGNTLTQCPTDVNLNKFKLKTPCSVRHTSQLNSWIRYAVTRNIQYLHLWLWDTDDKFILYDDLFFNNSCITRIKLHNCVFTPPNATICWDQLKFLSLEKAGSVGDIIGIILSGSPCLETLELHDCYGISRIDATSTKFKNLVLTNYGWRYRYDLGDYIDTIEINAPYMLSLTIQKKMCVEKILLLNVSSLVKADFNYHGSHRFADLVGRHHFDIEDELLSGLLSSLAHVKDITLGDYDCSSALYRLRAKGFQFSRDVAEDRITEPIVRTGVAAAETSTEERGEQEGEYDDMISSLFD